MRIVFREASSEEFAAIGELLVAVFVGEGFTPDGRAERLRKLPMRHGDAQIVIALDVERRDLVGAVFLLRYGSPLSQISSSELEAELRLLAVHTRARGRGIGEALVRACLSKAASSGCARVVLRTQPTMAEAQRLYERLGFRRNPGRDSLGRNGLERLAYELDLTAKVQ